MVGVSIRTITKRFGDTIAVDDVSLEIRPGELFFLLGPSGCGKTTILRVIAGFETPESGELLFEGRPMLNVPAHRRNAGLVFQNYALWPHMTVEQNVAYGLDERRIAAVEKRERVQRALARVHMQDYRRRMPNQLSGGQQQRVALARALVIEPDVVLLDEPLSNLDARLRLQMRQEIRRIHDETGITMIYVTHDQKESLSMADTIAVMSMGRVEQVGTPRAVYRTPANRFVADFIGETNLIPGTLLEVADGVGVVHTELGDFRARCGFEELTLNEDVLCMVRPECLTVKAGAVENRFKARMIDSMYLGEVEQFRLETVCGPVRSVRANPGESGPAPGTEMELAFSADDAVILRNDAAAMKCP